MPFPFSASGKIVVDASPEEAIVRLTRGLEHESARGIETLGVELRFRGGVLRLVSSLNQLVAITTGVIVAKRAGDRTLITYRLTFFEMFVVSILLVGMVLGPPLATRFAANSWLALPIGCGWLWLFGANYVLTLLRFPRFLRKWCAVDS